MYSDINVSVIVPVYNVASYLRECLDSLLNQTLKDIEIICVDDCSSDNSLNILEEYIQKDNIIKVLKHLENKGSGEARNTGLKKALGEYISFIDSDDFIDSKFLETLFYTAKKYNSDISLTTHYIEYTKDYKPSNLKIKSKPHSEKGSLNSYYYLLKNVWSKLYRREFLIEKDLFFVNIRYGIEDTEFDLRVFLNEPNISFNDKALYYYRLRDDSLSSLVIMKLESSINSIRQMENAINYCKNKFPNCLAQMYLMTFETVLYCMKLSINKKEIYKYVREFVNNITLYDSFYPELKNQYFLIKNNEDYQSYMIEKLSLELSNLQNSHKKLVDNIAWFIPVRKWRDNFRNKLYT